MHYCRSVSIESRALRVSDVVGFLQGGKFEEGVVLVGFERAIVSGGLLVFLECCLLRGWMLRRRGHGVHVREVEGSAQSVYVSFLSLSTYSDDSDGGEDMLTRRTPDTSQLGRLQGKSDSSSLALVQTIIKPPERIRYRRVRLSNAL